MNPRVKGWLLTIILFLVLASFPLVPVLQAAVIPDPVYRNVWRSMWQLMRYTLYPQPGLQYQFPWYSLIVVLIMICIGILVSRLLLKRFS